MNPYLKLFFTSLIPVAAAVFFYLLDKKTAFGNIKYWPKQIVYGLVFGGIAVFSTEFGVPVVGVTMNVRDAAPVCAGLIFGAPAGVIAGVIGGVERYLAALWGAGTYTRIACSVSTAVAGLFAALLRKFMFDDKKPAWYYGLASGIVAEVIHMLMLFITNLKDARNAIIVVEKCTIPMVSLNGLAVMLAVLLVGILGRERLRQPKEKTKISQNFQKSLLICVIVAFGLTSSFTYVLQSGVTDAQADELMLQNIVDVNQDVSDASDENLMNLSDMVLQEIRTISAGNSRRLQSIQKKYDVAEINVVDGNGIIVASTYEPFVGYNMADGEQSAEFLVLLDGVTKKYIQAYQATSFDSRIMRKYAGVALAEPGFVQVAYDSEDFHADISEQVVGVTRNRHVGETGCIIICDESFNIVSDRYGNEGKNLDVTGIWIDTENMQPRTRFESEVYGELSFCMYDTAEGYYIIAVYPEQEALLAREMSIYVTVFMEVLVFTALFILVYFLIKRQIVDNINKINGSLGEITDGNLDIMVNVRSNAEFASLSDDINSTVETLRRYIDEAAARIDKELEFAKTIQASALPSVFPPYPNHKEFDIWASMKPAKEVGGDFYDFYMIGEDKLAFLIADVSGKGIPAAMFMMTSKTMLKNMAEAGNSVETVFTNGNQELCETNNAGMFVTAWMGVLDLRSGTVSFANAGHNPPLIRHGDGSFEYLKSRAGFVLAGMEGVKYRRNELQLQPGDMIYLYTDGVTEATDSDNGLYGEDRLLSRINEAKELDVEALCRSVKAGVDEFVGEAPQFDDITMLCLKYNGATEENK